jgi:hypothetical protein
MGLTLFGEAVKSMKSIRLQRARPLFGQVLSRIDSGGINGDGGRSDPADIASMLSNISHL